jgi:hypothetical protein
MEVAIKIVLNLLLLKAVKSGFLPLLSLIGDGGLSCKNVTTESERT